MNGIFLYLIIFRKGILRKKFDLRFTGNMFYFYLEEEILLKFRELKRYVYILYMR